ncbi:MAG: AtpZ/AtpI family protein [Thermoleophilia bacterium]
MSKEPLRDLSQIGGIGFTLVSYVLVFTGGGYLLDRLLHTDPWLMVGGVFVGAALGFFNMIRMLTALERHKNDGGDDDEGAA